MITRKNIFKVILIVITSFMLYLFIGGTLIFKTTKVRPTNISYQKEDIIKISDETLYAKLVETPKEALDIRLKLIEEAKESIRLSTYFFVDDLAGNLIGGALLKRADEGVKIDILVDGLFIRNTKLFKVFKNHKNINYYIFEPRSILVPHSNQNVLHVKLLLIDEKYGLIGGRNISDRFLIDDSKKLTYDRDVLIYSDQETNIPTLDMITYFDELTAFNHTVNKSRKYPRPMVKAKEALINIYEDYGINIDPFHSFLEDQIQIDNATFVHSPINRMNKYPIVAETIFDLYEKGNKMTIQSPYITESKLMNKYFKKTEENKDITLITNNITTNPNLFAVAGYFKIRKNLAKNYQLYEFQNKQSIHGKTVTIGDDLSVIGSLNMDHRSFFLSTECVIIIYSKDFNEALTLKLDDILNQSLEVNQKGSYIKNDDVKMISENKLKHLFVKTLSIFSELFEQMLMVEPGGKR